MSPKEVHEALYPYVGHTDTWRTEQNILIKAKSYNPFKQKPSLNEDIQNIIRLNESTLPNSLQMTALAITRSSYPEIQNMITVIQGEKRLTMNSYQFNRDHDLRYLLFFFRNLEAGYLGSENKKYLHEYAYGLKSLTQNLRSTYERAQKLKLPMIIEFESSSLIEKSPLTRLLFNTIIKNSGDNPARVIKAEVTRDGGRLLSLAPEYAKLVIEDIEKFTQEFDKNIRILRANAFSDKSENIREEAKQRIIELLSRGEGLSSIYYADERLSEIEKAEKVSAPSCRNLFMRIFGK